MTVVLNWIPRSVPVPRGLIPLVLTIASWHTWQHISLASILRHSEYSSGRLAPVRTVEYYFYEVMDRIEHRP